MKRGWITWDRKEIAPAAFESRIDAFREVLEERRVPAGVVYSELWRSNQARSLQNFMPYFNRALLAIPAEGACTLICGLSPRVYGWIRSVTPIRDVRPGGDFPRALENLATERAWTRIGLLDEPGLPFDIHAGLMNTHLELVDIESEALECPALDATEIAMRRKSVAMARIVVESEIGYGAGRTDHALVGRLERGLRAAGAEDVVILIGHAGRRPAPAGGESLEDEYSVSIAVEYRGHWTRISRSHGAEEDILPIAGRFEQALSLPPGELGPQVVIEDLSGGYPYRSVDHSAVRAGFLYALHVHDKVDRPHRVYGDTCIATGRGWTLL